MFASVRSKLTLLKPASNLQSNIRSLSTVKPPFTPHPSAVLYNRNLLSIADLSPSNLQTLLSQSIKLKALYSAPNRDLTFKPLLSTTASLIFQKRSTRTRVSTETITSLLGGHALFLGSDDIQLGVNESLYDTTRVLSGFNDFIVARVFGHEDVVEMAAVANPYKSAEEGGVGRGSDSTRCRVINALSSKHHPLQTLADLQTLIEHYGPSLTSPATGKKLTVAWVGDGNNILHDLALGCAKLGVPIRVATPVGYEADSDVMAEVKRCYNDESKIGVDSGMFVTTNAKDAVQGADVVVTDTWVSMGEEAIYAKKISDFAGYQVNATLMASANPGAIFLHCLPRKQEEVSDEVFYDEKVSKVWGEAENRMWTVGAVMMSCLGHGID